MPHAGNIQFVTAEELLDDADQLHRQKLLIAAETFGVLQKQLSCSAEDQVLQTEVVQSPLQIDFRRHRQIGETGQRRRYLSIQRRLASDRV